MRNAKSVMTTTGTMGFDARKLVRIETAQEFDCNSSSKERIEPTLALALLRSTVARRDKSGNPDLGFEGLPRALAQDLDDWY